MYVCVCVCERGGGRENWERGYPEELRKTKKEIDRERSTNLLLMMMYTLDSLAVIDVVLHKMNLISKMSKIK